MAAEEMSMATRLRWRNGRDYRTTNFKVGVTNMEKALGALINVLNPYSNPTCKAPNDAEGAMRAFVDRQPPKGAKANGADLNQLVAQLDVEVDNYQGGEWSFMGQMYKIKRALLIPYRYEVQNKDGVGNGVWATGYLVVGYVGGDGGG
jgi:hypothetical protein